MMTTTMMTIMVKVIAISCITNIVIIAVTGTDHRLCQAYVMFLFASRSYTSRPRTLRTLNPQSPKP